MVRAMTESPTDTPSSVRPSSSPREQSPIVTGVSALSSSTNSSEDVEAVSTPLQQQRDQHATGPVVETLSDSERVESRGGGRAPDREIDTHASTAPQSVTVAPVHITAADYADRRRLLNHITYLSTQLQRAQLQVEDLTRTVCILRGVCGGGSDAEASGAAPAARAAVADGATTAAVLAAREESEVHAALQSALAVFDPVIAQTQIYRLDDALAQVGLLREAELAQLQKASTAAQEHRALATRLSEEVTHLRRRTATLEQQKQQSEAQLTATTMELERLRHEELRLNQRVAGLQELAQDGTWLSNVRVVGSGGGGGSAAPSHSPPRNHTAGDALALLENEEQHARQGLLLEMFWDPVLIAFDAGVTWITDSAALRIDDDAAEATETAGEAQRPPALEESERLALVQAGVLMDGGAPPSDADLLLLRRQQGEVTELRARVQLLQDRGRVAQLEKERLQFLYESEMRRSERMAQDHVAQLQQAYDEVVKDRQCIMKKLKDEVEEQLRLAFEDGRAYERSSGRSRSRPPKKVFRPSKATAGE